jgi:predicted outer membrane repeat protein
MDRMTGNGAVQWGRVRRQWWRHVLSESNVNLTDVTFADNRSDQQGGAVQLFPSGNVTLTNVTLRNNQAGMFGGGVAVFGTSTSIPEIVRQSCFQLRIGSPSEPVRIAFRAIQT